MAFFQTAFGVLVRDMNNAWVNAATEEQRQAIHAQRRAVRPNTNTIGNKERGRRVQERIEAIERDLLGDSAQAGVSSPSSPRRAIRSVKPVVVGAPVVVVEATTGLGAN